MKLNIIIIIILITILFLFLRYLQLRFRLDKYHFKNNKKIRPGETFIQKDLSKTLYRFSKNKSKEFRNGKTVQEILKYCKNSITSSYTGWFESNYTLMQKFLTRPHENIFLFENFL